MYVSLIILFGIPLSWRGVGLHFDVQEATRGLHFDVQEAAKGLHFDVQGGNKRLTL